MEDYVGIAVSLVGMAVFFLGIRRERLLLIGGGVVLAYGGVMIMGL